MTALAIPILRYLFLLLLFVFLYRIVRMMVKDLKGEVLGVQVRPEQREKVLENKDSKNNAELIVLTENNELYHQRQALQLRKNATLGRGSDNNIIVPDPTVSKKHAKVWEEKGTWLVEDLGSKNGTFVNDLRVIKPTSLKDGDRVRLGDFVFQFVRWNYEVQ